MHIFDEDTLIRLMKLSRIECSLEEKKLLQKNLSNILNLIKPLEDIDTEGVEPCYRVLETLNNVMREDRVSETLPREAFLANAPSHVGGMIRVPPIIINKQL